MMTPSKPVETGPHSTAATTTSRTASTRTITVGGTPFAYRELGPSARAEYSRHET